MKKTFFDDLLIARGLSMRQLAKRMDILPSQLSLTFNGKRRMQMGEAVRISQILGAPLSEVVIAAGIDELRAKRCRVVGVLAGNGLVTEVDGDTIERVLCPDGMPDGVVALQARTGDSALAWVDGWVFFVNGDQQPEEQLGRFCLATLEDGKQTLATIRRGYLPGTFNLSGFVTMQDQRVQTVRPVLITRH